jgi:hypothetical protein
LDSRYNFSRDFLGGSSLETSRGTTDSAAVLDSRLAVSDMSWKRYLEVGLDAAVAVGLYYLVGWIGVVGWAFFVAVLLLSQLLTNQRAIVRILTSRLPDRCAFCHREILDEGGIVDEEGIYHAACIDTLDSLEEHRRIAGVPPSESIHKPRPKKEQTQ